MPTTKLLPIKKLKLDLRNYRTVHQRKERDAVHAMISIDPDWFWALMESILADGYHATENIIVVKSGEKYLVKEGNRRIGALKIIYDYVSLDGAMLPSHIQEQITSLSSSWKSANSAVPCAIYGKTESDRVDKIVTLIHGKGEKAGRRPWKAVARARHNRDMSGASEPGLDLLEKYLKDGKNCTALQRERWGGDYPLTVLDEAIKKLSPRLGYASSRELVDHYPRKIKHRSVLEDILRDVGTGDIDFKKLRIDSYEDNDLLKKTYGIPVATKAAGTSPTTSVIGGSPAALSVPTSGNSNAGGANGVASSAKKSTAVSMNDPRAVFRALRKFSPKGNNREKLVTLLYEARRLKLDKHAHAFCFLLRSMFEISAKAYCQDHAATSKLSATMPDGQDKKLVTILRDITNHLTKSNSDKIMTKALHGAIAEIAKPEGFLSVTSMNQLVHNPKFTVDETHISTLFGNIFPLLEEMNR